LVISEVGGRSDRKGVNVYALLIRRSYGGSAIWTRPVTLWRRA